MSVEIMFPLNENFQRMGATKVSKIVILGDQEDRPKYGILTQVELCVGEKVLSEVWLPQDEIDATTVEVI